MAQWEHANKQGIFKRRIDFFIEELRRSHEWRPKWNRKTEVLQAAGKYYGVVRKVLRGQGYGKKLSLRRCSDCRILFLTSISNRWLGRMRCVFGCREAHNSKQSSNRSRIYYQTEEGKQKKRQLNQSRSCKNKDETPKEKPPKRIFFLHRYYRWLVWVIDHRNLSNDEILELTDKIQKKVRQRTLPYFEKHNRVPP